MRNWYFIVILFCFYSCADLQKPEHLKRIDSLEESLEAKKQKLTEISKGIDSALIRQGDSLVIMLKSFEEDTVSVETAKKLNTFKRIHETIPVALELKTQILEATKDYEEDLKKLRSDISEGRGRRGKYEHYINREEKKFDVLSKEFERCIVMMDTISRHIPEILDEMNALVNERISLKEVQ